MANARSTSLSSGNRQPSAANKNLLLAALPAPDYARLLRTLEAIPLKLRHVLHKPGEPIQHVYFPGGGFCSMVAVLKDGTMVEIATIGREGMVGAFAALNGNGIPPMTMVQGETAICYQMPMAVFHREMERRGVFYELVTQYTRALVGFVMQSAACNAIHSAERRLARWLLLAQDRMSGDDFPLTQEFVAMMLGVARPTVSVVLGTLQRAGPITYRRGHVTVVNREKLEAASCECYGTVKAAFDRLGL